MLLHFRDENEKRCDVLYDDSFSDGQTHLSSRKKEEEERNLMV